MHCYACCDARRATTLLLLRQLQKVAMLAVQLLRYYYKNYNTMPCLTCYYCSFFYEYYNTLPRPLCYYYTTITTTTTRCRARRATTTLLLRQLQHAAVHTVQILHYYYDNYKTLSCPLRYYYSTNYDNYNTLLCPPCYYYTTSTTTTTRCRANCAITTLLLRQLEHAAMLEVLPLTTTTTTRTRFRARRATTALLLRQLQHAAVPTVLLLHYYYDN